MARRPPVTDHYADGTYRCRALANLLERDRLFTDGLRQEARQLGLKVIEVGSAMIEEELAHQVTSALGL